MNHFTVQLKLTQHRKSIIVQLKKKKKKTVILLCGGHISDSTQETKTPQDKVCALKGLNQTETQAFKISR